MSSHTRRRTVITHFYNEAYLLPWWCQHHYPLFDHGICIDYDSTDGSADIIRKHCPGWEVRQSRNRFFGAVECDQEVMMIEASLTGWWIVLNTTEFLIGNMESLENEERQELIVRSYTMVDSLARGENYPTHDKPLIQQNHYGYDWSERSSRSLRQKALGYIVGRHPWNRPVNTQDFAILWYGFAPYNEHTIARKLQIQTRIPAKDVAIGFGSCHITNRENLDCKIMSHAQHASNLKPLIDSLTSPRADGQTNTKG